jgi:GNAT superfamily N-acetyltransferase
MAFGLPQISFIGYPLAVPCAGHAGLGFRGAGPADAAALVAHYRALGAADRRMRFCATLTDAAAERHVAGLWPRRALILAAHDGPLWSSPLYRAGPIRAVAELSIDGAEAELGLSVEAGLRRRGVGTYLVQAAARLLAPRGVRRIGAYTLPDNHSFIALAHRCGARVASGPHEVEVEVEFDVAELDRAYRRRRAVEVFRRAA